MKNYKERECPTCGKKEKLPEGVICFNCQKIITENKKKAEEFDRIKKGEELFGWQYPGDLLPALTIKDIEGYYSPFETSREIEDKFEEIFLSVSIRSPKQKSYNDNKTVFCSGNTKKLIEDLSKILRKTFQNFYDEGVKDGKKLLFGLNSGKVTLKEFEKNQLKRERD